MKETKVYVDELPEECWECFCRDGENGWCKILERYTDYVPRECPLIDIKTHDRELIKEVCEKIRKNYSKFDSYDDFDWFGFENFLDQLQKEFEK